MGHHLFQSPYQSQTWVFSFEGQLVVRVIVEALNGVILTHAIPPPLHDHIPHHIIPRHVLIILHTLLRFWVIFESFQPMQRSYLLEFCFISKYVDVKCIIAQLLPSDWDWEWVFAELSYTLFSLDLITCFYSEPQLSEVNIEHRDLFGIMEIIPR